MSKFTTIVATVPVKSAGKLTKAQRAYLLSASINPIGQTSCFAPVLGKLVDMGLVEHRGLGHAKITDAGRKALANGDGK